MIKTKYGSFDGNSWEELCQVCLKIKYEKEGYQELPAAFRGDMGIEGYTRTGIVFQCYCPDEDYSPDILYQKQRDKITRDLNKLISNEDELKFYLDGKSINRWYFLTPLYKNKELIKHCTQKAAEFKTKKLEILSHDFDILVYDGDLFASEIPIALNYANKKLEIIIDEKEIAPIEWENEHDDLVDHAIKKHSKRVQENIHKKDMVNKLTDRTIGDFLKGSLILKKWQEGFPQDYQKYLRIVSDYEGTVEEKCMTNVDNYNDLYSNIQIELKNRLKESFQYLDALTIEQLMKAQMADWLLRCPINFY